MLESISWLMHKCTNHTLHTFDAHPVSAPTPCRVIKTFLFHFSDWICISSHTHCSTKPTLAKLGNHNLFYKFMRPLHILFPPNRILNRSGSDSWKQLLLKQPTNMNNSFQSVCAVRSNVIKVVKTLLVWNNSSGIAYQCRSVCGSSRRIWVTVDWLYWCTTKVICKLAFWVIGGKPPST